MNVELLEKVKAHVLAEPRRVRMEAWVISEHMSGWRKDDARYGVLEDLYAADNNTDAEDAADKGFSELLPFPACGTVACIAGWGKILSQPDPEAVVRDREFLDGLYRLSEYEAAGLFEIDGDQGERLFHLRFWPLDFQRDYGRARNPDERAQTVVARIDHFIATNGTE